MIVMTSLKLSQLTDIRHNLHQPPTLNVCQCHLSVSISLMDWLHLIARCGWGKGLRWWGSRRSCILVTPHYRDRHHGLTLSLSPTISSHYVTNCGHNHPDHFPPPAGHNNLISSIPSIPIIKPSPASRLQLGWNWWRGSPLLLLRGVSCQLGHLTTPISSSMTPEIGGEERRGDN